MAHYNKENGKTILNNDILKELEALMSMSVLKKLPQYPCKARARGYPFSPFHIIFDVKVDLRIKERLLIGVHVVNSSLHDVYVSNMKLVSSRILLSMESSNGLEIMMGDIRNAYLNANTKEKKYTRAGPNF